MNSFRLWQKTPRRSSKGTGAYCGGYESEKGDIMSAYYWVKLTLVEEPLETLVLPRQQDIRVEVHIDKETGQLYGFVIDSRT